MLKSTLIVASGVGRRFYNDIPKQFSYISEKTVLEHTVDQFLRISDIIIVIVEEKYLDLAYSLFHKYNHIYYCVGGETRQNSVLNGLLTLQKFSPQLVAIHDGVRPLISEKTIIDSFRKAGEYGSAIPMIPVTDSLWQKDENESYLNKKRELFALSQTPQTFAFSKIFEAYMSCKENFKNFTDCASVYHYIFNELTTFTGDKTNIKLTTKEDLEFIRFFLSKKNTADKNI